MNRKKLSGAQIRVFASKRAKECEKNKQTLQELRWFYKATNQNTDLKVKIPRGTIKYSPLPRRYRLTINFPVDMHTFAHLSHNANIRCRG